MQAGDRVRTVEGYEDTVMPGYEGRLLYINGDTAEVQIDTLNDGYKLAKDQDMKMHVKAHKLEVIG